MGFKYSIKVALQKKSSPASSLKETEILLISFHMPNDVVLAENNVVITIETISSKRQRHKKAEVESLNMRQFGRLVVQMKHRDF
jgi:hypothetical protein